MRNCWEGVDERGSMMFSGKLRGPQGVRDGTVRLQEELASAEVVVIGAGAGLSASSGFEYTGQRFDTYFQDFAAAYSFDDMYSGGFYPYKTMEEYWAFWSRYIWINRYQNPPEPVYNALLELMRGKEYFVLTTNVDHQFQRAGFDKERLFYTQGDYGLWQCSKPCHKLTYDNEAQVQKMVEAQGFVVDGKGELSLPEGTRPAMSIPTELVPYCPRCGKPLTMNLRADDTFIEDAGWQTASARYAAFLQQAQQRRTLFLELGTGYNTPGIIKYSFWQMADRWQKAVYSSVNLGEAYAPVELGEKAICIDGDIGEVLGTLARR